MKLWEELTLTQQVQAYINFLDYGCWDTWEGFGRLAPELEWDEKTLMPYEREE